MTQSTASDLVGQQHTDEDAEAFETLFEAHFNGFTTKSNFAREKADAVAMLACCGLISTSFGNNQWSNLWKVTPEGLNFLSEALESMEVHIEEPTD